MRTLWSFEPHILLPWPFRRMQIANCSWKSHIRDDATRSKVAHLQQIAAHCVGHVVVFLSFYEGAKWHIPARSAETCRVIQSQPCACLGQKEGATATVTCCCQALPDLSTEVASCVAIEQNLLLLLLLVLWPVTKRFSFTNHSHIQLSTHWGLRRGLISEGYQ